MDSIQEDTGDSRTSAVGRKRNLEERQDQDPDNSRHSSPEYDTQRALKRVKEDDESLGGSIVKDGTILNTSSPLRVASPSLLAESLQTPTTTSQAPLTIAAPLRAGAWNRGVQSGVRTSFGDRAQAQLKSKSKSINPSCQTELDTASNADKTNLPQKSTQTSSEQDEGADRFMAEMTDKHKMPTSVPLSQGQGEDVPMAQNHGLEMPTATSSEEEGEILSSKTIGEDAGGEISFLRGTIGNANSLQPQLRLTLDRADVSDGKVEDNAFIVDLQPRETTARPKSTSPVDEDMKDISIADVAEIDTSPARHDTVNPPFKLLSEAEEARLTIASRSRYLEAKSDWTREQKQRNIMADKTKTINRLTAEAEAIFAHQVLPLPSKYSAVEENICAGLTFFPRNVVHNRPMYQKKNIDYTVLEVLKGGRPIRIQDLTLNIFAPSFLNDNLDKWNSIKPKMLSAAYNIYRAAFYSPEAIALGGANASNKGRDFSAKMLKEAQKKAKLLPARHPLRESATTLPNNKEDSLPIDITEIDINQADMNEMERNLQEKYFPLAIDRPASYHCLACGDNNHMTIDCPSLTCTLCGGDHVQLACPQSRRCQKCRQCGHDVTECPEKLSLSKAEAIGCDFCGSTDHFEINCHTIWRTYRPKPKEIRKVREISVHCYICGGAGHYGPECGLFKECPLLSGGQTWSQANLLKYLDANSADRAISAGIDYSIASKSTKGLSIKGKANNPINFDDSDDDVTFLHEKVKGPKHNGQIKIAGTARLGQISQQANFSRATNPPRDARSHFSHDSGRKGPPGDDSAGYGRERTLSPSRFDDVRYGFPDGEDRYGPQAPPRENSYRSRPPQAQNNYQPASQAPIPVRPPSMSFSNASRGGRAGRGNQAQNGGNNAQGGVGAGSRGQPKRQKRSDRGGGITSRGGGRRGNRSMA